VEREQIHDLRFLVVDDDPFQREAAMMQLASIGARHVLCAESGAEALDMLRTQGTSVDVLLSDLNMPGMDGMALLRHLAELDFQGAVILVSALDIAMLDSVSVMAKAYGLSLLGAMPKPLARSKLLNLLMRYESPHGGRAGASQRDNIPREEIIEALKRGEFVPYFQPKVEMASGRVMGVEALARWNSPIRGLLAPVEFLDAIESFGLMDALTWIMLAESAAIGRAWQTQGLLLAVSINLSLSSLSRAELAERVFEEVAREGLDSSSVILEVTESAIMNAVGPSLENLTRLRLLGFGLSIDDYGTGYSSLQQLARVPFTELKIDQSFVKDLLHQETTRLIVESSLDIARKLNLKVTAEGVETLEQWDALNAMGCDIAQGHLIARPMPAEALPAWLEAWPLSAIHAERLGSRVAVDILLVEDDPFQREIYTEMLVQLHFGRVDTAQNVAEALEHMAMSRYDLIISDFDLDDSSGLELVRRIRTHQTPASPDTRLILLSVHTDQDLVFRSIVLDVNGLLPKPTTPSRLREAIQQALDEDFKPKSPAYYLHADLREIEHDSTHVTELLAHAVGSTDANSPQYVGEKIPLSAMNVGMVLVEPIYARGQTLVMNGGHTLTPTIISRLLDIREHLASQEVCVVLPPHLIRDE